MRDEPTITVKKEVYKLESTIVSSMICVDLLSFTRLVTTDEDNKRLKTELSELKARHRLEIERITREKEQEMDEVHKR